MAHPPQHVPSPDLIFLRNMGLGLVIATLVAGAVTLSLTIQESRAIILAGETSPAIPDQKVAVAATVAFAQAAPE
jgi:hypothetical protein